MLPEQILLAVAILLLVGVGASKASSRLGVPALLLFLCIGMLAGSEGIGGIPYEDAGQAQFIGVVALAFILFAGGLDTDASTLKAVAREGIALSTLGVGLTAILVACFARFALDFSWLGGLLLGSIVSSTDAAAVFAVLRSHSLGLKGKTQPLLELESGSNDPMAVLMTIATIRLLQTPDSPISDLLWFFVLQMAVGAVMGFLMGRFGVALLNALKLESEGLYPVATLALVLAAYSLTSLLGGNGFLAVYLAGIVMSTGDFIHKRSLTRFHDGVAWLMQITMFLVLGLLVFPSRLVPVAGTGILISIFLIFVARPVAVFISLAFARLRFRQKLFIAWVGLRGAVPIILATFPLLAGVPNADMYFNVVFFIVIASVLVQGTSIPLVAKWLRLETPMHRKRHYPIEFVPAARTASDMAEVEIPEGSPAVGRRIMDLPLPKSALVILIGREDDFIAPRGATVLQGGDTMLVLAEKQDFPRVQEIVNPAS